MVDFDLVLGIDQCGAVDSKKQPKPLHSVLFDRKKMSMSLFSEGKLKSIKHEELSQHFLKLKGRKAIVIDCVLGLPKPLAPLTFDIMKTSWEQEHYGLKPGKEYFESFTTKKILREVEIKVGAHTLFSPYPSQRNIQTGTYRIWRDLTFKRDFPWFDLWPYNWSSDQKIIECSMFESYPSYVLKKLIGFEVLKTKASHLSLLFPELTWCSKLLEAMDKKKDILDASANALLPYFLVKHNLIPDQTHKSSLAEEGWILGVPYER